MAKEPADKRTGPRYQVLAAKPTRPNRNKPLHTTIILRYEKPLVTILERIVQVNLVVEIRIKVLTDRHIGRRIDPLSNERCTDRNIRLFSRSHAPPAAPSINIHHQEASISSPA